MFSYQTAISQIGQGFGASCSIIWRWRGSIFQLLWKHFLAYFAISVMLGVIYRFTLTKSQQVLFDDLATYCQKHAESMILTLMLSFFTGTIMSRWTNMHQDIPGTVALIRSAVPYFSKNEQGKKCCYLFTRYVLLTWILLMQSLSVKMRSEYPTLDSLCQLGLLMKKEKQLLEKAIEEGFLPYTESLSWILWLIEKAKEEGLFVNQQTSVKISDSVINFEKSCVKVLKFQETNMPLPFIQVVVISVYLYGITNLLGAQFAPSETLLRGFFPFLPSFKFFGFLIWLRMGEIFMDPFGKDESDLDSVGVWENEFKTAVKILAALESQYDDGLEEAVQDDGLNLLKIN